MKKWKEYTRSEKGMVIAIGILLLAVLLSFGRIQNGFEKGMTFFFTPPEAPAEK